MIREPLVRKALEAIGALTLDELAELNRRLGGGPGPAGDRKPRRPRPREPLDAVGLPLDAERGKHAP